jgi:hypothetical protein
VDYIIDDIVEATPPRMRKWLGHPTLRRTVACAQQAPEHTRVKALPQRGMFLVDTDRLLAYRMAGTMRDLREKNQ